MSFNSNLDKEVWEKLEQEAWNINSELFKQISSYLFQKPY